MESLMVLLKKMAQLGKDTIEIEYTDGIVKRLRLKSVQNHCPCNRCSQKQLEGTSFVTVSKVVSVGRYGLKFHFLSGCQQGVYSHQLLRGIPCDI
ncbi:MAG: DUF971 domain-containing protein [Chlamydiae bacterium]|nr:DUF971 domain-containing protein [Chlamydiota bacterium]